jgi:translation initiation factor eIF-2B subunit epsilon
MSIRCISSPACQSAGDALRELDAMNIIRSDPFVLISGKSVSSQSTGYNFMNLVRLVVSGDVVSNLDLKKAIAFHKAKRAVDPNAIMTLVLKKVAPNPGARPVLDDLVVGMHRKSAQVVIFEDNLCSDSVHVPVELFEDAPELDFCADLLDCHVDICSPELILQFSDNFDYQDIRHDFVHNEVSNWALGKHIYAYTIQNEYAARVQDPRTYHTISRDIVTRWAYPLVPEIQLLADSSYVQSARYVYKESHLRVSRSAQLVEGVVIGAHSAVGARSVLTRCTLGRNVSIGSDVRLAESHLWKGVVVENGASITQAIVCDHCVIGSGAVIHRGCVLGYGVIVQPHAVVPAFTRLFKQGAAGCDEAGTAAAPYSNARVWLPDDDGKAAGLLCQAVPT